MARALRAAFGGGWTRAQILRIMRDTRNGSYATMGACLWVLAKSAAIAALGGAGGAPVAAAAPRSVWALGASAGAGPAIVVAQCVSRASAAPGRRARPQPAGRFAPSHLRAPGAAAHTRLRR